MILWTIKTLRILKLIQETGTYICDTKQIPVPDFTEPYDWLAKKNGRKDRPSSSWGPIPCLGMVYARL